MQDHLDKTTSVSVELTETGVKAKAKSRFVAAVDRFGGNLIEIVNAPMERRITRQRAISAGEVKLVEAVTEFGIEKLKCDPEFAERTAEKFFTRLFEKQANKDRVLIEALEDLRHSPPTDEASAAGEDQLAEEFIDRLETYAEGASTAKLQQKWGRVLSSEVRKPGTFSPKVLRIVDEIETDTANLFERVCGSRIRDYLPKCLIGELPFQELSPLVMAGLLIDPGMAGHIVRYDTQTTAAGKEFWVIMDDGQALSIPKTFTPPNSPMGIVPIGSEDGRPVVPVYLLTDAGKAIATIFANSASNAFSEYSAKVRAALPDIEVLNYVKLPGSELYRQLDPSSQVNSA
ncbi:DUF2806 domain-containing protein [Bradyrhizobium sp. RDM12]